MDRWRPSWRLNLAQQFLLGSLIVLIVAMAGVGAWVARQIEDGVVQRSAATTALYVDSLVAPALQDLATGPELSQASRDRLRWLFEDTPLGREILLFRVWDRDGRTVFSSAPEPIGQPLPPDPDLLEALDGRVAAAIGDAEGGEALSDKVARGNLLEIYSPVRGRGTNDVIGAAEFYYAADDLRGDIADASRQSWLVVGGATLIIYLLLAAFVRRASDTIEGQQRALGAQVTTLTELLAQNEELHQRARGAAARTVALNERFLRRFSSELHDGPAQDISLALLRLDNVAAHCAAPGGNGSQPVDDDLGLIQSSLRRALQELRSTSGGILLPQLGALTVAGTIEHVARGHRRRTGDIPEVQIGNVPEQAPLATKIAAYRIIQEALANAARHAPGAAVSVAVEASGAFLRVVVRDDGPGFDPGQRGDDSERLGLVGIRERVESLGGRFRIESAPGQGTRITAELPLTTGEGHD
ncbi:MAG: sensor histidine kinase [Thermomicrobiales bacterium]|nr:sensor histidine kinase [Thermomicrobiales bacterium]